MVVRITLLVKIIITKGSLRRDLTVFFVSQKKNLIIIFQSGNTYRNRVIFKFQCTFQNVYFRCKKLLSYYYISVNGNRFIMFYDNCHRCAIDDLQNNNKTRTLEILLCEIILSRVVHVSAIIWKLSDFFFTNRDSSVPDSR